MELANLLIGLTALAVAGMALPTIFQMLFGRPKLTFDTDEFTGPDGTILVLRIKNDPVKNKFLRHIGVEREAADVLAFFEIQEQGTGKYLVRMLPGLLTHPPTRTVGILARSMPGFSVGLTVLCSKDGAAGIVDARAGPSNPTVPLPAGHYIARMDIIRGQDTYRVVSGFQIGKLDHEAIWYGELNVSRPE